MCGAKGYSACNFGSRSVVLVTDIPRRISVFEDNSEVLSVQNKSLELLQTDHKFCNVLGNHTVCIV